MDSEDRAVIKKRAWAAMAAAVIGWLRYLLVQAGTRMVPLGLLIELFGYFCLYLLLPFTFSGLLLALIGYVVNRVRGVWQPDITLVLLMLAGLALAFYVTAPVLGAIAVVKCTAVFLVFRLIKQLC